MPLLSVIVTITCGADHTSRCLQALSTQSDAPPIEIIVPLYASLDDGVRLRRDWPGVRFIEVPEEVPSDPGLEHWLYDRRRAVGLASAGGDVVAMIEDHAIPDQRWCATIWDEHRRNPYGVIGGGIMHSGIGLLNWAVYYCDFARYQPPFPPSVVEYVSDVNVSYKRATLETCRDVWQDSYDETSVHGRIREAGDTLYLTPDFVVGYDRGPMSVSRTLLQRRVWGRAYAGRRAQKAGPIRRLAYVLMSPGLAPLLLVRKFLLLCRRRQALRPFMAALPITFLCLLSWSLGEFIGYVTAQPFSRAINAGEGRSAWS
jgi:hypothetical protein